MVDFYFYFPKNRRNSWFIYLSYIVFVVFGIYSMTWSNLIKLTDCIREILKGAGPLVYNKSKIEETIDGDGDENDDLQWRR